MANRQNSGKRTRTSDAKGASRAQGTQRARGSSRSSSSPPRPPQRSTGIRPVTYSGSSRRTARTSSAATQATRRHSMTTAGAFFILAIIVVVAIAWFGLRSCAGGAGNGSGGTADEYVSPYDWSCIQRQNGRWHYVVDGQVKSRLGIDVSEGQGVIDWQKAGADGIDYVMVRAGYRGTTEGGLYEDDQFRANMAGTEQVGLPRGVYFFSQAISVAEAREEADFVMGLVAGYDLQYPIAFDSEVATGTGGSRTAGLSKEEMTQIAMAFCTRLREGGYSAVIYGNANDLDRIQRAYLMQQGVWWAEYGTPNPSARLTVSFWQYSNTGTVAGIQTSVDMNMDLRGVLD